MSDESQIPDERAGDDPADSHFVPTGTLFILGLLVATMVMLWMPVYVILLSRGVTL